MYYTREGNQPLWLANEDSLLNFIQFLTYVCMYMLYHTTPVINPSYMYLLHGYRCLKIGSVKFGS